MKKYIVAALIGTGIIITPFLYRKIQHISEKIVFIQYASYITNYYIDNNDIDGLDKLQLKLDELDKSNYIVRYLSKQLSDKIQFNISKINYDETD